MQNVETCFTTEIESRALCGTNNVVYQYTTKLSIMMLHWSKHYIIKLLAILTCQKLFSWHILKMSHHVKLTVFCANCLYNIALHFGKKPTLLYILTRKKNVHMIREKIAYLSKQNISLIVIKFCRKKYTNFLVEL